MEVIHSYHHHTGHVGVLARFSCGSDFTFRTLEFKVFMDNVCMALAADEGLESGGNVEKIPCVHDDETLGAYIQFTSKLFKEEIKLVEYNRMTA